MLASLRGKRLMILGGVAVVALAGLSVQLMKGGTEEPPPIASAKPLTNTMPGGAGIAVPASQNDSPDDTAPNAPKDEDVFQRQKYTYRSLGRVDPFESLVKNALSDSRYFGDELNPETIRLVGILEKDGERRALIEDTRGFGYVLKKGDPVMRGRVTQIGAESVRIRHSLYGVTETITLKLDRKSQGGFPHEQKR